MRKALLIICLLAAATQLIMAQARLAVDTVYSLPEDTLFYNSGTSDIIIYTVRIVNNGNDAYNGSISLRAYHNGDTSTTEEKDQWVVSNFEVGQVQTVTYQDSIVSNDARYKGGNNIIVIWPHSDSPGIQAPDSSSDSIYIDGLTAIDDPLEFSLRVDVWPNPVRGKLNLHFFKDVHKLEHVRIVNHVGQVIQEYKKPREEVFFDDLSPGMYFINIRYKDGVEGSFRIIKQ